MIKNTHIPTVLALGVALAILLISGLHGQDQANRQCENCTSTPQFGEQQSLFHSNQLAYQLTQNEAQALARQGWIHAAY